MSSSTTLPTSPTSGSSTKTLLGSIVLFRHGSRAITKSCIRNLKGFTSAGPGLHIESEWGEEETEYITNIGEQQLQIIGKYFSSIYLHRYNTLSLYNKLVYIIQNHPNKPALPLIKWRSSDAPRVINSGEQFWSIIKTSLPLLSSICPSVPLPYKLHIKHDTSSTDPPPPLEPIPLITLNSTRQDILLLNEAPFGMGSNLFTEQTHSRLHVLRHSENMEKAALRVRNELESIYSKVTGHCTLSSLSTNNNSSTSVGITNTTTNSNNELPLNHMEPILDVEKDTTIDPSKDLDDIELTNKLWCMYNVKEMYDCEIAWPGTATALRNHISNSSSINKTNHPNTEKAQEDDSLPWEEAEKNPSTTIFSPTDISVLVNVKNMLLQRITEKDENFINHSSHWLWDQRYFSDFMHPYTSKLGSQILLEILTDLQTMVLDKFTYPVAVYSGHDHTIYSILAALRAKYLPKVVLGFCAYLIFEVYRDETISKLNPKDPLAGISITVKLNDTPYPRIREGYPLDFEPDRVSIVCEDVDITGLLQYTEKQYRSFRYNFQQEYMKKVNTPSN